MVRLLCGAAALMLVPAAAQASDCSMPEALAQRVCAQPELRKLDAELAAKEAAVLKASPRPATWSARGAQFRAYLATATDLNGGVLGSDELGDRIESEIETLDKELARAAGIKPAANQAAALGPDCLAGWFAQGCSVPASGILRDRHGMRILWQLQEGASDADGVGMGVMLWDASAPGAPVPIGWTFEGADMRSPRYNPEQKLLWVPGTRAGSGGGNADLLYQKQGDRWIEIELTSWRDELDRRLPKGLGAWQGVAYDFVELGAETPLWRDGDGNCCATGGRATIGFRIDGSSVKLDTLQVQQGGPNAEWKDF